MEDRRRYRVVLELSVDLGEHDAPNGWDWASVLDEVPEHVSLISSEQIAP